MPPPSVGITRAKGQPAADPGTDFRMCIVGTSSTVPAGQAVGALSTLYPQPGSLAVDFGIGDGVDACTQALTPVDGYNPQPPALAFFSTLGLSGLTPGVRGATLTTSGVTGGATVTKTAATHPQGTYEPVVLVEDDGANGAGTTIGTAGIVLVASVDNGRTWLPSRALGTATTFKVQIPNSDGTWTDTGVQYDFGFAVTGSADITASALYGSGGTLAGGGTGLTLILTVNGTAHTLTFDSTGGTNAASEAAMLAAIHSLWSTLTATAGGPSGKDLVLTDSVPGGTIVVGAGTANAALGLTPGTYTGALKTGDTWSESKTTPPQWAVADLFTAGSPPSGVFATIAQNATNFGMIALIEPVAAGDIATLSAALDGMKAIKASCRPTLVVRFRDQAVGEDDATYIASVQTFLAACARDPRIMVVAGDGWLTDAFRKYVYSRNGLAAILARAQGNSVLPGPKGERVAQSLTLTNRGPMPDFSVRDTKGNPVGHDERVRGGILGPIGGQGGACCFYYEGHEEVAGTYPAGEPTLYDILPTVTRFPDNRVSSGIERALYAIAFQFLGGADVVTNGVIDDDTRDSMAQAAMRVIKANYANEFANAQDPNLVTVSPNVTTDPEGNDVVTWYVADKLYNYTNAIRITVANTRA